jgi:hypothetical protein
VPHRRRLAGKTQARPRRRHLPRLLQIVGITEHQQSLIVKAKAIRVAVAIITVELFRFMTTPALGGLAAAARQSRGPARQDPVAIRPGRRLGRQLRPNELSCAFLNRIR